MVHLLEWMRYEREREKRLRLRIIGLSQEKGGGDEVEEAGSSKLTTFEKNKRAEE